MAPRPRTRYRFVCRLRRRFRSNRSSFEAARHGSADDDCCGQHITAQTGVIATATHSRVSLCRCSAPLPPTSRRRRSHPCTRSLSTPGTFPIIAGLRDSRRVRAPALLAGRVAHSRRRPPARGLQPHVPPPARSRRSPGSKALGARARESAHRIGTRRGSSCPCSRAWRRPMTCGRRCRARAPASQHHPRRAGRAGE